MSDAIQRAFGLTRRLEGGWYAGTEARDRNPTMRGVTQRVYDAYRAQRTLPPRSVLHLGRDELDDIYRTYWAAGHCEPIAQRAPLVAIAHYDAVFNSGPGMGRKVGANHLLQRAVEVTDDGVIGPKTLEAIRDLVTRHGEAAVTHDLLVTRRNFLESIMRSNPKLRGNARGWGRRLVAVAEECGVPALDFRDPLWHPEAA